MNKNTDLLEIYKYEIERLLPTDNFAIKPPHPFLLSIPEDYHTKIKVIIGQEPNGWLEDLNYEPI